MFDSFFDWVFGPIMRLGNVWAIAIIAFILTAIITIIYKFMTDQELMKSLKKEIKELQNEMNKFKNDPKRMMNIQKKLMEKNMHFMKHSMKPTLFTFLPIILVFGWLKNTFDSGTAIINLPFSLPLIGNDLGWLGTYIIFSLIFSFVLRKLLKVY